jgi:hypothetical protein
MAGTDKKKEPSRQSGDRSRKKPPPSQDDDENYEDGDIATPKLDRYGNDDEPL